MTIYTPHYESAIADAELRQIVSEVLTGGAHGSRRLMGLERRLYDYRSSFAIEEVTAHFSDGSAIPLILKDLSNDNLLDPAREARPAFTQDAVREVAVYRDILAHAELGTAACYAAIADVADQRYWILLERVSGADLVRASGFQAWLATARWLAEAHRQLTPISQQQGASLELMRYDGRCFDDWIDQAARVLQQPQVADGQAVAEWEVEWLVARCRSAAQVVALLPQVFIHGEFYPSNILIDQKGPATRVCPIDWETAGIGPGLLDLAALVAGNWTDEQKNQLASAYFNAVEETDQSCGSEWERIRALRCCRLLLAMKWIGWMTRWQPPLEQRFDWLAEALRLCRLLNVDLQQHG